MRRSASALILVACFLSTFGQGEAVDSLKTVLKSSMPDSSRVSTLLELSAQFYRTDAEEARRLAEEARQLAEKNGHKSGLARSYKAIGMSYYFQNKKVETLMNWKLALEAFRSMDDQNGVSNLLNNIGAVYFNEGDDKAALDYYLESLRLAESQNDSLRTETALVNIGTVYLNKDASTGLALRYYRRALPMSKALRDYDTYGACAVNLGEIFLRRTTKSDSIRYYRPDSALFYFETALEAYRNSSTGNVPFALKSIGRVYTIRKDYDKAIHYQTEAYQLAKANDSPLEMAQSLLSLAETYKEKGDIKEAIATFEQAASIAVGIEAQYEMKAAYDGLAENYAKAAEYKLAYTNLQLSSDIKDTLYNADMDKKLQAQTLSYEIEKKEGQISLLEKDQELKALELKRQKAIRNGFMLGFALVVAFAGVFFFQRNRIAREKERSEELLLNILPKEVAEELKAKGEAEAKLIRQVTVLFTDFKGFTAMSELVSPEQLVRDLHECFSYFDRICGQHGMEKIKTIGDAYMAAGGLPVENSTHATDAIHVALAMRDFIAEGKARKIAAGLPFFEIRIGIHTGPVVAGIVGVKKFQYDIWGDTVNTASRMESSGAVGQVNISEATYAVVREQARSLFHFTPRGKVQAKGKGEMEMYFVERRTEAGGTSASGPFLRGA